MRLSRSEVVKALAERLGKGEIEPTESQLDPSRPIDDVLRDLLDRHVDVRCFHVWAGKEYTTTPGPWFECYVVDEGDLFQQLRARLAYPLRSGNRQAILPPLPKLFVEELQQCVGSFVLLPEQIPILVRHSSGQGVVWDGPSNDFLSLPGLYECVLVEYDNGEYEIVHAPEETRYQEGGMRIVAILLSEDGLRTIENVLPHPEDYHEAFVEAMEAGEGWAHGLHLEGDMIFDDELNTFVRPEFKADKCTFVAVEASAKHQLRSREEELISELY